jgi:hypothetical protein
MANHTRNKDKETYQIQVQGWFSKRTTGAFADLEVSQQHNGAEDVRITVLTGPIIDQAALRSILNKLWDLNLSLVSVQRLQKQQ